MRAEFRVGANLNKAGLITFLVLTLCPLSSWAVEINVDKLADAIYLAEGKNSKYPYGIRSVVCHGEKECRKICINTIQNNIRRFEQNGGRGIDSYLVFLSNRYCPIGAGDDVSGINKNWLKNVKYYYER